MNQTFFTINLSKDGLTATNLSAIFFIISPLLIWQHITQWRIGGEIQAANLIIDGTNRRKFFSQVYIRLDIDRFEAFREASGFVNPIILFDVLTRTSDSQQIQQFKIIEAQHIHQPSGTALNILQS